MANIPIPENDDSLELNVRYQPDMVLEGMLDATVPEFKKLTLTMGGEVYDLAGGGSDLPEYTDSDVGKVLTVAEGADTQNLTLFPEQTAETGDPYEVQNASNLDKFVVGAVVTFTIDDEPYERTVSINELNQLPSVTVVDELSENTYMLVLAGGKLYLDISAPVGTTAEVSATVEAPIVELAWEEPSGLPEIEESDEGKVLTVDQGEAVWGDAPSGLPEITNADEGKVLTVVDNSGTLEAEWVEPSGGGLSYFDLLPLRVHVVSEGVFGVLKTEFDSIVEDAPVMFLFQSDGDTPNASTALAVCSTFFKDTGAFDLAYSTYTTETEERWFISATKYKGEDPEIYVSIGSRTLTLTVDANHPTYYTGTWTQS